jgi:hypothetical protein
MLTGIGGALAIATAFAIWIRPISPFVFMISTIGLSVVLTAASIVLHVFLNGLE